MLGKAGQFCRYQMASKALVAWILLSLTSLASAATGLEYLQSALNADGSFGNSATSLATSLQSTSEVLRAYQALGEQSQPPFPAALSYLGAQTEANAEYLARRILVYAAAGLDVTQDIQALLARQNADGAFADQPGYASSVLDTAHALEALAAANYTSGTFIGQALGYLLNRQLASGAWGDRTNGASVFVTTQTLRALLPYRTTYPGVSAALTAGQNFLLGQRRPDGQWSEPFETALALLAILPGVSDLALAEASVAALAGAQLSDGSWVNDPYSTALALRALHVYQARKGGSTSTASGALSGYVRHHGSSEPVAGAQVSVLERGGLSVLTNGEGFFAIPNLTAGQYTLTASKSGYSAASGTAQVSAGQMTLAGTLVLSVGNDTGLVSGKVFDAVDQLGLAGAVITLSGGTNYSATTDTTGVFSLGAVQPGSYTVNIVKSGYQDVGGAATVVGGQPLSIIQGLVKAGGYQDSAPGSVSGAVVDARTGVSIAGAVFDLGAGYSSVSGADGQFLVSSVPRGDYTARLSANGYLTQSYTIAFPAGAIGNLGVLALYPASNETAPTSLALDGVVVDGVTGTAVAGATVKLVETGAMTTADAQGGFAFSGITLKNFSLIASASGYETSTLSLQVGAFGQATVKLPLSPPGTGAAASTLQGTVRDAQTSAPIANAQLRVAGTSLSATTDASGNYQLSGVDELRFGVVVSAVGYAQATANIQLAAHGQYTLDPALDAIPATRFQVLSVEATHAPGGAHTTALFTTQVASLLDAPTSALVVAEVRDAAGTSVATLTPYAEGTTSPMSLFDFAPAEVKTLTVPWPTGQLAPGNYTLIVRVVEPGTINRAQPLGEVLAENSTTATIVATYAISGGLQIDPPLTQAGAITPVELSVLIQNVGNVPLPAGGYELSVAHPDTGAPLHVAQAAADALETGTHVTVSFGTWVPTSAGNLSVVIRALTPGIPGEIRGPLYVGDKASGTFTVNKLAVPEGTHTVRGRISMQGVDTRTGTSTDPLFALVKEAVRRGGLYTAPEAVNWHTRNRCLGCHIQTQSAFGLASALDKADVERNAARFLYNTVASSQQGSGALYISHPEYAKTQSYLGLWALGAWPDKTESFRTSYKAAKFLHDRRFESGNLSYWSADHASGWWYSNVANTALAIGGFADVLRSARSIDLSRIQDFALSPAIAAGTGTDPLDIEVGPDGVLYVAKYSGSIVRLDPATGAATTVVTGLPANATFGLAFGPDGTLYVSGYQYLRKVNADGSTQTIYTSNGHLTDVETGPDGLLYLADHSNHKILRLTAAGQVEVFASGGLFRNPYGLAFDPAGNLLVANYGGFNVLKIAPDRSVSVFATGLAFRPVWLAATPDGRAYVSTHAPNGLYHINPSGTAETAVLANTLRGVVVKDGRVWVGNQTANTLHELRSAPLDTAFLADFRTQAARGARYFLTNYRDNTSDNIVQAMRMIGLAYAREVVTDTALLADINAAISDEDALLRARQRADGGWGRYHGQGSDALVTAMVGIALDYTDPSPNDPQIRRIIQFLLNTQGPDGSWTNANNGLSTRLAATSFVMAYLPKALDRLGGIDTDLSLELPANVQLANPSIPPTKTIAMSGGGQKYLWQLLGVTSAGRMVDFDLTLSAMQLHERRPVAMRAYLEFANSFTSEKLQVDLDIPSVLATADMALGVSTDKPAYLANEAVTISATVANVASTPASGQVLLSIRAPGDATDVATLAPIPVNNLAGATQQVYFAEWNTGTTFAGAYEAYGRLLDTQGRLLSESVAPIAIHAPAARAMSGVTSEKPIYDAWDTAQLNGRVQNLAPNAVLAPVRVELTVRAPAGAVLFFQARELGELGPRALRDLSYSAPLVDAAPGLYPVELVVKDAFTRTLLSTATTAFEVQRREVQALRGTVSVQAARVYLGEANVCTETARNVSGRDLSNVKLIHQLINMDAGQVFDEYVETVNLAAGAVVHQYFRNIDTRLLGLGGFSCVIKAAIGAEASTLAFGGFQVVEPPIRIEAGIQVGHRARLLILLDGPHHGCGKEHDEEEGDDHRDHGENDDHDRIRTSHADSSDRDCADRRDPHGPKEAPDLPAQRQYLEQLLTQAGWSYTLTDRAADFVREFRTGGYALYGLFAEHEKLSTQVQKELQEAVFRGEGLILAGRHDERHHPLIDVLGVKVHGALPHAAGVTFIPSDLSVAGDTNLFAGDKALRIDRTTAQPAAVYTFGSDQGDDCEGDKAGGDHRKSQARKACGKLDAVTVNVYGQGRTVFAGFDWLMTATHQGSDRFLAQALLRALDVAHPTMIDTSAGRVIPLALMLTNKGIATDVRTSLVLPEGVRVIDAGSAQAQPALLVWNEHLGVDEIRTYTVYLRLPDTPGPLAFKAKVEAPSVGAFKTYAEPQFTLDVRPPAHPDLIIALLSALLEAGLPDADDLQHAQRQVEKAQAYVAQGRDDQALSAALKAAWALHRANSAEVAPLRLALARWIGALAQRVAGTPGSDPD